MTDLAISLLDWQQEVWNDPARFKVVAAGRRTGKSRLAAYLLIVNGLKEKGNVFYVAPTQGQARDIMWNLMLEIGEPVIKASHINNQQITLINGTVISLKGSDRGETMRGVSLQYLCIDELSEMKPEVWELILRPALSDKKAPALFIGTPTGRNHFYDMFIYGNGDDPDWKSWHFTSYDNKLIDKNEIDSAKRSMSSFAFRQEFMASFEARGSEMFKEEWVTYDEEEPKTGDYYIAVDLAGFSEVGKSKSKTSRLDNTAISIVKVGEYGWWVKDIIHGRWDLNETAIKIFNAVRDYQPISVGIERGIAKQAVISPLTDLMRQYNRYFRVEELTHGNKSKVDRVMWALQGRFENGVIKLNKGSWNEAFCDELFQFPDSLTHDDLIDSLSYIDQVQQVSYHYEYEIDEHEVLDSVAGY